MVVVCGYCGAEHFSGYSYYEHLLKDHRDELKKQFGDLVD